MKIKRELPSTGILQDWVAKLELRHQGGLLSGIVRGCDTAPKDDESKVLTRALRALILNTHCADPEKSASFIEHIEPQELRTRIENFCKNCDHYPHHYVMHLIHAIEIVGYYHPKLDYRTACRDGYNRLCNGLHTNPETKEQLDERLNADEETFAAKQ